MHTVSSPNSVLANALGAVEDVLAPHLHAARPRRVELSVGTQINGVPHIGTSLVQSLTFALAARIRDRFGLPVQVVFGALDNAPHETLTDAGSGHIYQRALAQTFAPASVRQQIEALYQPLFDALSQRSAVPYRIETYSQHQAAVGFRTTWLRLLPRLEAARWWLAPPTGTPHLRVPCPAVGCGWAEKHAERTRVAFSDQQATVSAVCLHHGPYESVIRPDGGGYLDLSTLYRNVVKELTTQLQPGHPVRNGQGRRLDVRHTARQRCPPGRRAHPGADPGQDLRPPDRYPHRGQAVEVPDQGQPGRAAGRRGRLDARHEEMAGIRRRLRRTAPARQYGAPLAPAPLLPGLLHRGIRAAHGHEDQELQRNMSDTTTTHDLNIYQRYFDLVASGTKTIEVRVRYPHLADTKAGTRSASASRTPATPARSGSSASPRTSRSKPSSTAKARRRSTRAAHGTSSSRTSAASTAPRRKPWEPSPSRSNSSPHRPADDLLHR